MLDMQQGNFVISSCFCAQTQTRSGQRCKCIFCTHTHTRAHVAQASDNAIFTLMFMIMFSHPAAPSRLASNMKERALARGCVYDQHLGSMVPYLYLKFTWRDSCRCAGTNKTVTGSESSHKLVWLIRKKPAARLSGAPVRLQPQGNPHRRLLPSVYARRAVQHPSISPNNPLVRACGRVCTAAHHS